MANIYLFRRHTAADWTSLNPTLLSGELGLETDTRKFKFGDGITAWTSLSYAFSLPWDGDKGDLTVSASGTAWTIDAGAVTLAKMANMATASLIYRKTAGTGAPEVQTLATLKTDLGLTGTNSGDETAAGILAKLLTVDGAGSGLDADLLDGLSSTAFATAAQANATHTGDVTGATALTLATVNSNVGSFGLAGAVAQITVNGKGLVTAAADVAISIAATAISDSTAAGRSMLTAATAAAQTALLSEFASGTKGLAPASGGGTTNFLRADGTWTAVSSQAPRQIKAASGQYVKFQNEPGTPGTASGAADRVRIYPYVPAFTETYSSLAINCSTAVGGSNAKVVVYASDTATGQPTTLLGETGDMSCATTGVKTAALSITLTAGVLYWVGVRTSSTQTLSSVPGGPPLAGRSGFGGGSDQVLQRSLTYSTAAQSTWTFLASEIREYDVGYFVIGIVA